MTKRTQILTAAEIILAEHGFYAFSMQTLADKAGVAAGTIYRYFENKEALMNELQKFIKEEAANNVFNIYYTIRVYYLPPYFICYLNMNHT